MKIEDTIAKLAESVLPDDSYFIVEVSVKGDDPQKLRVYIDGDEGVNIDACAKISRQLAELIEEEDLFQNAYNLEVSSPGIDHPLQTLRQYQKNVGRRVKVQLAADGKEIQGKLLGAEEKSLKIAAEHKEKSAGKGKKKITTEEMEIPFTDILKTKVLVSFK